MLLVLGQSMVATLDPAVALMPAFVTFLAAGTIMAKSALGMAREPRRAPEPSGGKAAD